jgi:hypothetical protein
MVLVIRICAPLIACPQWSASAVPEILVHHHHAVTAHDRDYLLGAGKRNDILALDEVLRYGSDSFGDRDYVCIYGLKPADWYASGIRLLARDALSTTSGLDVRETTPLLSTLGWTP